MRLPDISAATRVRKQLGSAKCEGSHWQKTTQAIDINIWLRDSWAVSDQEAELLNHHNDASKEVLIALYTIVLWLQAREPERDHTYTHTHTRNKSHILATPINLSHRSSAVFLTVFYTL